ncbi:MAG: flagellar hook-associated protein 3 [Spirochaetales bacterium]|nr:flagellar hook-associated protein 3 [Spirochaetales bacterium]MCF7937572.1 flagellar hook-associated protein 3 [Spirochaetales bacterium]
MYRISTNMPNNDMQFYMLRRQWEMNKVQNSIAEQTRLQELRDDPIAAAHAVRYESLIGRMNQFSENIEQIRSRNRVAEGHMQEAVDILHRVRELAVQGSNGTYAESDLNKMGTEVNELLEELVLIANAKGGDGSNLFGGSSVEGTSFRTRMGRIPGSNERVITNVDYLGTNKKVQAELSDNEYVTMNFPGNEVFWAENQEVYAQPDATGYIVQEDSSIIIDDTKIDLKAGDNITAIMNRINSSDAAVKANLDPVKNSLVLKTTTPHQLWVEDGEGGTVMRDLGVVDPDGTMPENLDSSVRKFGGSLFDMVINLRDNLLEGNHEQVGGSALKGIDKAMNNLLSQVAELGGREQRINMSYQRLQSEIPEITGQYSRETDPDMASAITDLKMLEHTHKAALGTAGRILQPTLLDFLR